MTLPVVVVLALFLGRVTDDGKNPSSHPSAGQPSALAPITVAAPPSNAAANAPCIKVLGALPVQVADLAPRVVHPQPDSPYVVAWGEPPVVLRCGVPRPSALVEGSTAQVIAVDGVNWLPVQQKNATVWTAIDRAAYVEVTVPRSYPQPPLAPIADAIAKALPIVCVVDPNEPDPSKLCTHRK